MRHRLSGSFLDVVTDTGVVLADEHVAAPDKLVLTNFSARPPCRRKHRRPPSAEALAEADRIRRHNQPLEGEQVVADFACYAAAARPMQARKHRSEA